jgi:hypothetical protein
MAKWKSCKAMFPMPKASVSGPDFARVKRDGSGGNDLLTFAALFPAPRANKWGMPDSHGKAIPKFPTPLVGGCDESSHNQFSGRFRDKLKECGVDSPGSLNPDWVEALMLWPVGWTSLEPLKDLGDWPKNVWVNGAPEPDVPRVAKGVPNRSARIKAIGNGQVPHCAAAAFIYLYEISKMGVL